MTRKAKRKLKQKLITKWDQILPKEGVVIVYGHRREGKTATAWERVEKEHLKGRPVASFMFPRKARHLLPSWVKHVTSIKELKKLRGYVVIADEMALHAFARDFQSEPNKELFKLMAVAAQCHQLLYLICQHCRQLDVGLAMEPDLVIFKRPSLLHIRFARPELRQEIQEAWDAFQTARGDVRSWAYVVDFHHGRHAFLRTRLPSFWSQELSEAYARYEMESLTETKHKVRKNGKNGRNGEA